MTPTLTLQESIQRSVLCWLATCSLDNSPNVSPKEIFAYFEPDKIIIANIASPQSVKNIRQNEKVCVSFIDILVQKGFQVKGKARIVEREEEGFEAMEKILLKMTGGRFPFAAIIEVSMEQTKLILAPSYVFYPDETTEKGQVESARRQYGL
jgi:uncharacterized protein